MGLFLTATTLGAWPSEFSNCVTVTGAGPTATPTETPTPQWTPTPTWTPTPSPTPTPTPDCAGIFTDVPCPSPYADWIEQLAAEGITGGCGEAVYCPDSPVRRDQMAVFLLKAEHGPDYVPPGCLNGFIDVQCPSTFADWIEELATEGITAGCGESLYCPDGSNTRGQMAAFIAKTFGLQ